VPRKILYESLSEPIEGNNMHFPKDIKHHSLHLILTTLVIKADLAEHTNS